MSTGVFLGPTLPLADARAVLPEASYRPPVAHGDVYRAVQRDGLRTLAIIDGYFLQRPSVWHKEILWALDKGVSVIGASSMGALRAAELEPFGMLGMGHVFERFLTGRLPPFDGLCDDDEVAVLHGPPETGYLALSVAMVNIRATLEEACVTGIIDTAMHDRLVGLAKARPFGERDYRQLLQDAAADGLDHDGLQSFDAWLTQGRIDVKRNDALSLLQALAGVLALPVREPSLAAGALPFEMTEIFHRAERELRKAVGDDATDSAESTSDAATAAAVIDELRLEPMLYRRCKLEALIALDRQSGLDAPIAVETLRRLADRFRRANRLFDRESIESWLVENHLSLAEFDPMMESEARIEHVLGVPDSPLLIRALALRLRHSGDYVRLCERAERKRRDLGAATTLEHSARALAWYFEQQLGCSVPTTLEPYARVLGLPHADALRTLLTREFHFSRDANAPR